MTAWGRRVVLCTFGSLGDVHPYMAIGLELARRGHRPVIATSPYYREKVERAGLAFHAVRPDAPPADGLVPFMERLMDPRRGPEVVLREVMMPALRQTYEDIDAAGSGADLLVAHPLAFPASMVAERRRIPWASTVLAPISFLSAYDPPVLHRARWLGRLRRLGPAFHRALFAVGRRTVDRWLRPVRSFRAELGLLPLRDPLFAGSHSPDLVLALFSAVLGDRQPDWPPRAVVTGFCFYDRDGAEDATPDDLRRFLDAGPPPIVFTLGSTAVWAARDFYRESLEAARELGRRAVLLLGPDERNRPEGPLPPGVATFAYAPFSWLLPRSAAVVHQGGVGTTAQGLRAGVPMLVVPYGFDQFDNAARVVRLGVGRTIDRPRYRAGRVAAELARLLDDPEVGLRAGTIGRAVAADDGPAAAADAIEGLLSRPVGAR